VLPVVPHPINLFQDSGPRPDGTLTVGVAASSPGDAITFISRRDLLRDSGITGTALRLLADLSPESCQMIANAARQEKRPGPEG
jgi:hypothetical protein